jgi:hypothetical protein
LFNPQRGNRNKTTIINKDAITNDAVARENRFPLFRIML